MENLAKLIAHLKETGVLRAERIEQALRAVDRADFVPQELRDAAYEDTALPIGEGQTISQPYTVVFMLEKLKVEEGNRMLEAGYGSGWQTALLAQLAGRRGRVDAFELLPELCDFGKKNLEKYPDLGSRAALHCESAERGAPGTSFDRIICAAQIKDVPAAWREELLPNGRMVYPQGQSLVLEIKRPDGSFGRERFPGFMFVPFVTKRG